MNQPMAADDTLQFGVREYYAKLLVRRGYVADAAQINAVEHLQKLYEDWSAYKQRRSN